MVKYDSVIDRGKIPEIIDEWGDVIYDYLRYKAYGDPYGKGWRNWPCHVLDIIDCLSEAEGMKLKMSKENR